MMRTLAAETEKRKRAGGSLKVKLAILDKIANGAEPLKQELQKNTTLDSQQLTNLEEFANTLE